MTSWVAGSLGEQLFVSEKAVFDGKKAIRGGIPLCFPQFSDLGDVAAQHGFARTSRWQLAALGGEGGRAEATLELTDSEASRAIWPFAFRCLYTVGLSADGLSTTLRCANTGQQPLQLTVALHTYFRVSDASAALVVRRCCATRAIRLRSAGPSAQRPRVLCMPGISAGAPQRSAPAAAPHAGGNQCWLT